ncbi:hypothetical protein VHEMI01241 [[Torrubiella] hemipterigena]|nr:hypothetical protein VHEMI01241 [[Torrubiella] hemipterigena]
MRTLYPVAKVSRDDVLLVISALGNGKAKPSLTLQAALLRWLVMVYHVLDAPGVLGQAYPVLFNLLDTGAFRPQLTHVLALITRRKHVRPFRIQYLLNLTRQTGNDPCLVGLLRVYKDYYPEIIVGEAVRGKASAFKHPDPAWRQHLDELQEAHLQATQEQMTGPRDGFRINKQIGRVSRNKAVPIVHTSHANEDSVTLEEVENVSSFVQKMDKLEMPNQLVAVLADPLLQKLLILRPSAEANQRIANWLNAVMQDIIEGEADYATLWEVLSVVRDFVVQTKSLPLLVLNFFSRFLQLWDGTGDRQCILAILSFTPFVEFRELHKNVLEPLQTAMLNGKVETQIDLVKLYTNILHHWASVLKAARPFPANGGRSITELIESASRLAVTLLQNSPTIATQSVVLALYEQAICLARDLTTGQYIRVELPPTVIINQLLFSNSVAILSRTCSYLFQARQTIKKNVESTRASSANSSMMVSTASYPKTYVARLNSHVADACNFLWRWRAFNTAGGAKGASVPTETVEALQRYIRTVDNTFTLASIASFSYSPILCKISIDCMRRLEDKEIANNPDIETRHPGPVTAAGLTRLARGGGIKLDWEKYQTSVIEALDKQGFTGIGELLRGVLATFRNKNG